MQFDPVVVMLDQAMRMVALEAFKMLLWAPFTAGAIYLHARLCRR